MAIRHKDFTANTQLLASELQDIGDNGVVRISSASDLSNAALDDVNMVYQVDVNKVRVRISAGTGSTHWGNPFNSGSSPAVITSGGTLTTYTGNGTNGVDGQGYQVYSFPSSGSLVVATDGYAEVLIVGAGGQAYSTSPGNGARVVTGRYWIPSGTYSVTVANTTSGATSSIGTLLACGPSYTALAGSNSCGAGGTSGSQDAGLNSYITGSLDDYGRANVASPRTNRGDGRAATPGGQGSEGIVIVRVEV